MGECTSKQGERAQACAKAPYTDSPDMLFPYKNSEPPAPWFTCDATKQMAPRMASSGVAGQEATTLMSLLVKAAEKKGGKQALLVERPLPEIGEKTVGDKKVREVPPAFPRDQWTAWTYEEYLADVRRTAKGFMVLGLQQYESVNVWGFNAPEWHMSCIGAMFGGGKCAGLYPTDTPETAAYKVVHSGGSIIVVEDSAKVDKLAKALNARGDCKRLKAFVAYGFEPKDDKIPIAGCGEVKILSWKALLDIGQQKGCDKALEERITATQPGNCAALIYTSGTTGDPKAVMISHDNIIYEASAVLSVIAQSVGFATSPSEERFLSYLPLSHVAGMMIDIVSPIVASANSPAWISTFFARPYDLKEKAIKDRLGIAKPTLFLGVPLVWEKIADQIRAIGASTTGLKKQAANWAKGLASEFAKNTQLGASGIVPMGYSLASALVLGKIKGTLGLDECKYGFTGAAPIRVDTLEFFGSLGLGINEVYGMSECAGACTISTDQAHQWGSCGWQLPGVEVKAFLVDPNDPNTKTECPRSPGLEVIDERFQGELCFRGRNIMMGYLANPDMGDDHVKEINKKTAESIDSDGWLHSGDKGMVTEQGMVKITGRYKELIIGEGGENIAPVPIEDEVKRACDGICEVMMVGDHRKYNVALVTLKAVGANGESPGGDDLDAGAKRLNPDCKTISQAMDDKMWIDAVTAAITAANKNGTCCPNNAFKIQKFCILPTNFSEEGEELTPTKKLKRKVVETKYKALLDYIYNTDGTYIRYKE
mmetsp:Transcript_3701/g.8926  ORF Transcript_3701/g.8926 Transcript_3701/m.8926 type:complete len:766 (-) Transcript_3701:113-2410(-)